jgi:SAM-dependent methyltransferase
MKKTEPDNKLSNIKLEYLKKYLQGQTILDVGSGLCLYSQWLYQSNPLLEITAIDQLVLAQVPLGINYISLPIESKLPFQDQSFDTILVFDIIEHIENETMLLKELRRVCKPNGIVIGSVPHDNDKFLPEYNLTFYHRSDITHKRYYLPETIILKLTASGFNVIAMDLHGGVNPQVIAEFFPGFMKFLIKKSIGLLRRIGLINDSLLKTDLFFVVKMGGQC